jgi:hypothetical protein
MPFTPYNSNTSSGGFKPYNPEEIRKQKLEKINKETAALKKEADYLNSPLGLGIETAKETGKSLLGGAYTFLKSAAYAPVDIVRGFMGKNPIQDNGNFPTIQSQVVQKTSDVFEGKNSPLMATAELTGQTVMGAADVMGGVGLLRKTPSLVKSGLSKADEAYQALKASRQVSTTKKATEKVTEMISPKATAREARLAQSQGRFVEGREPTLFRGGTEDVILPSSKTKSAAQTIVENIPNAQKMTPSELYRAVDNNIKETATKLRPQMEATPIKPQTIEKLNSDWEVIKKSQLADAPATEEANVIKRQLKFESLLKKSGSNNHADLWDTAVKYDDSIPESVKKANNLSPESLQLQKDEWLQNRQILSDAIEKNSRPEFKQMSDMYKAKNDLLSKTKVEGASPSKIKQWAKDNPKKATALTTILGLEGLKLLGIDIRDLLPLP